MCGIAGLIDLTDQRPVPPGMLEAMGRALIHRGPDQEGYLQCPGLGLVSRRLSIVGLSDGRQPIANEDGRVQVVFNGEEFEFPEVRATLSKRGHRFSTHCDTEVLVHLWEEHREGMLPRLHGQFAFALWDEAQQRLLLARDRFGICPLFWTQQGGWLLFASEVKALLASGMAVARPDLRGIDQLFTLFALPGPITCFQGVQSLLPGHYLDVRRGTFGRGAQVAERVFWQIEFPDRGCERVESDPARLVSELEGFLWRAVEHRLRADVPVTTYLSGGVDSSLLTAMAARMVGQPLEAFTIQITAPGLDETKPARTAADSLGIRSNVLQCNRRDILNAYPRLIQAAEVPVSDTCCAALLLLAQEVHERGYKVVLTGEGSDEMLAGYPWYKLDQLLGYFSGPAGRLLGDWGRRLYFSTLGLPSWSAVRRAEQALGGHPAWLDCYTLFGMSRHWLYGPRLRDLLRQPALPFELLEVNRERLRRWHPLNQSLYFGLRVHLAGLLLSTAGDRVTMHSSVESRYPFLSEDGFAFLAGLHARWKMRGFREKYLLRLVARRWLPPQIAWRPKQMFRAPFEAYRTDRAPAFVEQLLSETALQRTGYFHPQQVRHWRQAVRTLSPGSGRRLAMDIGLSGVVATQLWHHIFLDSTLCDLPGYLPAPGTGRNCARQLATCTSEPSGRQYPRHGGTR
jgi:asparagine synthase (glutamine-hydrolysing)